MLKIKYFKFLQVPFEISNLNLAQASTRLVAVRLLSPASCVGITLLYPENNPHISAQNLFNVEFVLTNSNEVSHEKANFTQTK